MVFRQSPFDIPPSSLTTRLGRKIKYSQGIANVKLADGMRFRSPLDPSASELTTLRYIKTYDWNLSTTPVFDLWSP